MATFPVISKILLNIMPDTCLSVIKIVVSKHNTINNLYKTSGIRQQIDELPPLLLHEIVSYGIIVKHSDFVICFT